MQLNKRLLLLLNMVTLIEPVTVEKMFVKEGETIQIICPIEGKVIGWSGPPNVTVYSAGEEITFGNKIITNFKNKTKSGSVITVNNFTENDEGVYRCDDLWKDYYVEVVIKKSPHDMVIENETEEGRLYAVEFEKVMLKCRVQSGEPKEQMLWFLGDKIIKEGVPGSVCYELDATRSQHEVIFTCKALDSSNSTLLQKMVQLYIFYRPEISLSDTVKVKEGESVIQICDFRSNDPNATVKWTKGSDMHVFSNPLILQPVSKNDAGNYTCFVESRGGSTSKGLQIIVQYSPDVLVEHVLGNDNNKSILECLASGVPTNYTFFKWEHNTTSGDHIRYLKETQNGILTLLHSIESSFYYDSGIYTCSVSNGISGSDGSKVRSASRKLRIRGKPYFLKISKQKQFAVYGEPTNVVTYVYCYPKYRNISVEDCNGNDLTHIQRYSLRITKTIIWDDIYDQYVRVSVCKIDLQISEIEMQDFQNFTIKVSNEISSTDFVVEVMSASGPQPPFNLTGISYENTINVTFQAGFDGGHQQTFVLQKCCSTGSKNFTTFVKIDDVGLEIYSYVFFNLEFSTKYFIRIYSYNLINQSDFTDTISVITGDEPATTDVFQGVIISLLTLLLVVIIVFTLLYNRGRLMKYMYTCKGCLRKQYPVLPDVELSPPTSNTVSNELYSSTQNMQIPERRFAVSNLHSTGRRPDIMKGQDRHQTHQSSTEIVRRSVQDTSSLNYIEVCFGNSQPRSYIHGNDDRTPYADIDFFLKADPLPESENESSDDDFMNAADIGNFKKSEDLLER